MVGKRKPQTTPCRVHREKILGSSPRTAQQLLKPRFTGQVHLIMRLETTNDIDCTFVVEDTATHCHLEPGSTMKCLVWLAVDRSDGTPKPTRFGLTFESTRLAMLCSEGIYDANKQTFSAPAAAVTFRTRVALKFPAPTSAVLSGALLLRSRMALSDSGLSHVLRLEQGAPLVDARDSGVHCGVGHHKAARRGSDNFVRATSRWGPRVLEHTMTWTDACRWCVFGLKSQVLVCHHFIGYIKNKTGFNRVSE